MARKSIQERFWAKVNKTSGCWLWTASTLKSGYGQLGRGPIGAGNILAHRASWIIHYGEIPADMGVLHKCDVRACVNPEHLFLGTQKDNMADRQRKGRTPKGEKCGPAKLTDEIVRAIRAATGTQRAISAQFGIDYRQVNTIILGKTWRHLLDTR